MLHRAGILDMDQWFSDYGACDEAYLLHWYRTGERREFRSFWLDDAPLVKPCISGIFARRWNEPRAAPNQLQPEDDTLPGWR
jgi:hypothetical protein